MERAAGCGKDPRPACYGNGVWVWLGQRFVERNKANHNGTPPQRSNACRRRPRPACDDAGGLGLQAARLRRGEVHAKRGLLPCSRLRTCGWPGLAWPGLAWPGLAWRRTSAWTWARRVWNESETPHEHSSRRWRVHSAWMRRPVRRRFGMCRPSATMAFPQRPQENGREMHRESRVGSTSIGSQEAKRSPVDADKGRMDARARSRDIDAERPASANTVTAQARGRRGCAGPWRAMDEDGPRAPLGGLCNAESRRSTSHVTDPSLHPQKVWNGKSYPRSPEARRGTSTERPEMGQGRHSCFIHIARRRACCARREREGRCRRRLSLGWVGQRRTAHAHVLIAARVEQARRLLAPDDGL